MKNICIVERISKASIGVFFLFVASGFMLYLNRRTQLEGWDVELEFKKLAQRIDEPELKSAKTMRHTSV